MPVPSDNPIAHVEDDSLGRAPLAASFVRQTLSVDSSQGLVVGVLGPWGSGKTSFLRLTRSVFMEEGAEILEFNPWMFSGTEQLVDSFFIEISAQLQLRKGFKEIGKTISDYGEAFAGFSWLPLVGPWIERGRSGGALLTKLLERRREGTTSRREKVIKALARLPVPLIVMLDDIDRLSTDEIRDVFKLVRLTANFPNIVYVLAFDRERIEHALDDYGVPGRAYLEKILQVAVDLPVVPQETMDRQVFGALDAAIEDSPVPLDLNQAAWQDTYVEIIRPLIRNMRDVKRYAIAVRAAIDTLEDRIALSDLLALEAVRIFLPDLFLAMRRSVDGLCIPGERQVLGQEASGPKEEVEQFLAVAEADQRRDLGEALIRRLFPFAQRFTQNNWYGPGSESAYLKGRRVAHKAILRLYVEQVPSTELGNFYDAERAWGLMDDAQAFEAHLRSLGSDRQEDVIAALETWEDDFRPDQVVPSVVVLSNLRFELPERPRQFFALNTRFRVHRVVYRLLRSLPTKEAVEKATIEILPRVGSLSGKFDILTIVGYRENAGHELVSKAASDRLQRAWRSELRSASETTLAAESELLAAYAHAQREVESGEPAIEIPDAPSVTAAVLESARSESVSQSGNERNVTRTAVLHWSVLVQIFRSEDVLKDRLRKLRESDVDCDQQLLDLAKKYEDGWRPRDFGDELEEAEPES